MRQGLGIIMALLGCCASVKSGDGRVTDIHFRVKGKLVGCGDSALIVEEKNKELAISTCLNKIIKVFEGLPEPKTIPEAYPTDCYERAERYVSDVYSQASIFGPVGVVKGIELPAIIVAVPEVRFLRSLFADLPFSVPDITCCVLPDRSSVLPYIRALHAVRYVHYPLKINFVLSNMHTGGREGAAEKEEELRQSIRGIVADIQRYNHIRAILGKKIGAVDVEKKIRTFIAHPFNEMSRKSRKL